MKRILLSLFAVLISIAASAQYASVPHGELEAALYGTYATTAAGALMMLAGIPTASVYQHRIKKMSKDYNALGQKQEPVVSFRPASSGLGVAMVF